MYQLEEQTKHPRYKDNHHRKHRCSELLPHGDHSQSSNHNTTPAAKYYNCVSCDMWQGALCAQTIVPSLTAVICMRAFASMASVMQNLSPAFLPNQQHWKLASMNSSNLSRMQFMCQHSALLCGQLLPSPIQRITPLRAQSHIIQLHFTTSSLTIWWCGKSDWLPTMAA